MHHLPWYLFSSSLLHTLVSPECILASWWSHLVMCFNLSPVVVFFSLTLILTWVWSPKPFFFMFSAPKEGHWDQLHFLVICSCFLLYSFCSGRFPRCPSSRFALMTAVSRNFFLFFLVLFLTFYHPACFILGIYSLSFVVGRTSECSEATRWWRDEGLRLVECVILWSWVPCDGLRLLRVYPTYKLKYIL